MTSSSLVPGLLLACALMAPSPSLYAADPVTPAASASPAYLDVLELPAQPSALAARALINGVAAAMDGKRLVAVGQRGHIVYSDDHGASWLQARVPVSSDLVALQFPTALHGWAVGHDGVVLHTADGGATWRVQMDGRSAAAILRQAYDRDGIDPVLRADVLRMAAQGPDQPFLDVWFDDERSGFVVGAFNLIFHTDDGGATWQPWQHRVANPKAYHLNAIRKLGGAIYIAGEQGLLLKLDAGGKRFEALATPYHGSYFGIAGNASMVLVYGLRGNAWRSVDAGLSWSRVDTGLQSSLVASATLADGRIALAGQGGQLLLSADHGASFHSAPGGGAPVLPIATMAADGANLVLGGPRGLRRQPLPR